MNVKIYSINFDSKKEKNRNVNGTDSDHRYGLNAGIDEESLKENFQSKNPKIKSMEKLNFHKYLDSI